MNVWDMTWFIVTLFGLLVTARLVAESRTDWKMATEYLRPLARQMYRHELLRLVKQALLLIGIGVVSFRDSVGTEAVISFRSGVMAAVALLLTINSFWDITFLHKYFQERRNAARKELKKRASQ